MDSGICQPAESTVSASLADKAPAVLQRYFEHSPTFLTQHHTSSYESCVFREIPEIILSENPIVVLKELLNEKRSIYKYKTEIFVGGDVTKAEDLAIDVGAPIVTLDGGKTVRRMFPNEARIRNLTYATQFRADIKIRMTFTAFDDSVGDYVSRSRDIDIPGFPLLRLPVLLRSRLCSTFGAGAELLKEMGECHNDQGGYFIIDGSEKVLITRQEQAFNTVFVSKTPKSDLKVSTYGTVVCQHPITKRNRRAALYMLYESGKVEEGAIRVSIPMVKDSIPLFVLFRALGVETDEEIVRMIVPTPNRVMEDALIASIHDAWPITSRILALEFMRTLTKGFIIEDVLNILQEHVFSHVPNQPLARAQYLAEVVRKMLRVHMGKELQTNRDDIRNQRLLPTGVLLRGLFSEAWKLWKKAVVLAIDGQYNYNKSMYQDDNFLLLFSPANLPNILKVATLNDTIMRGFRGRWGTTQFDMKAGVIQPLARISYMDSVSHTRRIVSDFDTSLKLVGPRQLHPSQVGYFCTSETPTGAHIGATKNYSILTTVSVAIPAEPVMKWLLSRGGVIPVASAPRWLSESAISVQINGGTLGFTQHPDLLVGTLKLMKWTGCLSPMASISFNTTDGIIRIYLDDGRPLRPLWHLAGGKWPSVATQAELPSWRDLFMGSYPVTQDFPITSAAFVDPFADREVAPNLEEYIQFLTPYAGAIEYVDPYEGNEAYVSWWGRTQDLTPDHTHAEIHPSTMMGAMASMIPYANHNQSPRNQLSCSQSKQAIGYYATNYENRFDTYGSMMCYGEGALCRTIYHDAIAGGSMPYGTNLIFAINSFDGYNQDDGVLFNRNSIERGMFRSLALRSYETQEEEDPISKALYRIGNPKYVMAWTDLHTGYDYSDLDENGIIREGTLIHDKTVLVGRYMTLAESGKIVDASLIPTVFTKGRVDKVVVLNQANGMKLVKVRILEERIPELGDKFSTRHGQKGTMGMLMDAADMPRTAEGMVPDVMVNPHCIPSRMTMAQMLEQLFGKLGASVGAKINATSFMNDDQSLKAMGDALEMVGLQRTGEEILYSGRTGTMFTCSVFMGPMHFMRLKHLTQDKQNSRGAGRKEMRTHQPTGGRGNEGGMRIGEMERDVLIAHGVTDFLQESMMKRSDESEIWICNGCGTVPIFNEGDKMFVCPVCDGPLTYQGVNAETISLVLPVKKSRATFSKVKVPYALKLLDQEMTTFMSAGFRFLTSKDGRQFREPLMEGQIDDATAEKISEGLEDVIDGLEQAKVKVGTSPVLIPEPAMRVVEDLRAEPAPAPAPIESEDAPEDKEDEGQPARNEGSEPVVALDGQQSVDFDAKSKQYKEFSSYFPVKLTINGKVYPTAEHAFQAAKFSGNPDYQEQIRVAKTPAQAKTLGKTKDVEIRPDWSTVRNAVMEEIVRLKFANDPLKEKLLATGTALIRDTSPQDNYWGIGRSGKGQNQLGKTLMKIRGELQATPAQIVEEANALLVEPPVELQAQDFPVELQPAQEPVQLPQPSEDTLNASTGDNIKVIKL
jgi:DNA-directed RNA polymerase II subunit RPB2